MNLSKLRAATLAALMVVACAACTGNPRQDAAIGGLVNAGAVLKLGSYIRESRDPAATAARINATAVGLRAIVDGDAAVTLAQLKEYVQARYPSDWLPEERVAADLLLLQFAQLIGTVVDGQTLLPTDLVHARSLFDAVISLTNAYASTS